MKKLILLFSTLIPLSLSAQLTTSISSTDNICNGDSNGTATVSAGVVGASAPIMISEINPAAVDFMELTNVSGQTVNTAGWFVITSDDYTNINDANTLAWNLPASVPAGWIDYREDTPGTNYWGNNLFWNETSPGWVLLSDDQGNIVDFIAWDWDANSISSTFNLTANGFTFNITTEWTGVGATVCATSYLRQGSSDNDDATDFICGTPSKGTLNPGLTLPFMGNVGLSYLWSNGDTNATATGLAPGTYFVTTTTSTALSAVDTAIINDTPIPTFNLPGDTTLCSGSLIALNAGAGWSSYSWNTGASNQVLLVSAGGFYSCTVTNASGCPASDFLTVTEGLSPVVDLGPDSTYCANDFTLDAGGDGATYVWSDGSASQSNTVSNSGNYSVTVTSVDGCITTDDINLTLLETPVIDLGEDFKLCISFNQTQLLSAGNGFSSYAWSTGATTSNIVVGAGVTTVGNQTYSVTVTANNGCEGGDAVVVEYSMCVGIDENINNSNVSIFPNPANDLVTITAESSTVAEVQIFDLTGKMIYSNFSLSSRLEVNTSNYASGTYIVKVITENESATRRLIVQ